MAAVCQLLVILNSPCAALAIVDHVENRFDVSVLEQFWSWSVGIAVVGAPRDLVLQDLAGFIQSMNITHLDLTPSLARLLHPKDVPSLHRGVFITGGEALKQEIIDDWGPYNVICNGYGPTEATIGVRLTGNYRICRYSCSNFVHLGHYESFHRERCETVEHWQTI